MKRTEHRGTAFGHVNGLARLALTVALAVVTALCLAPARALAAGSGSTGAGTTGSVVAASDDATSKSWAYQETGSLTIDGCKAAGQHFRAYLLASMDADGTLTNETATTAALQQLGYASTDAAMSPQAFDSDTTDDTLRTAAQTWAGYVASAPDVFTVKSATARNGQVQFGSMDRGLYLVVADQATVDGVTYSADPILVSVPTTAQKGDQQSIGKAVYNVVVTAKMTSRQSQKQRVVKLWKDDGSSRPESVKVQIMNGTQAYQTVTLDASNNWSYEWEGQGDWSVRELDVPSGYSSAVSSVTSGEGADQTTVFQVTNSSTTPPSGSKSTKKASATKSGVGKMGDSSSWLAVVVFVAGAALVAAGLAARRRGGQRS
ncbi:MAG: Cna B-type domain-containing protein [Atopobiaceae bacterium]